MRWFVRGDLDGFFGLALDNLVQLLLIDTLCRTVLGFGIAALLPFWKQDPSSPKKKPDPRAPKKPEFDVKSFLDQAARAELDRRLARRVILENSSK